MGMYLSQNIWNFPYNIFRSWLTSCNWNPRKWNCGWRDMTMLCSAWSNELLPLLTLPTVYGFTNLEYWPLSLSGNFFFFWLISPHSTHYMSLTSLTLLVGVFNCNYLGQGSLMLGLLHESLSPCGSIHIHSFNSHLFLINSKAYPSSPDLSFAVCTHKSNWLLRSL